MAERRLVAYFIGRDELTPTLNRINNGLTNTARISDEASSRMGGQAGMLTREWTRFQHAFSHAFSYGAVYQIYEAYNNLKNFNSELGQLNAMIPNAGRNIEYLGDQAIKISTITGAPLNDVQESINNIIQSIPDLGDAAQRHLVPAMAQIEAMASRIMDVDPRSFGATVLGIARAYHPISELRNPQTGPKILESIASKLYVTRTTTPRVTGSDITQYIPTLIGGARAANFTLDQALAMFTVAQQTIQRPATTTQYLRQLMLRIQKPTSTAQKYFNQAGLTPDRISDMKGMEVLQQLIRYGLSLPGGASVQSVQQALRHGNMNRINVTGQAAQFFRNTIGGRIQSEVAMTALTTNLGGIANQEKRLADATGNLADRVARFNEYNSLQLMQNALSNVSTDLLRNFMPALGPAAKQLTRFSGAFESFLDNRMRPFDQKIGNFVQRQFGLSTKNNVVGGALDTGLTIGGLYGIFGKYGLRGGFRKVLGTLAARRAGQAGLSMAEKEALGAAEGTKIGSSAMRPFTSAFTAEASFAALAGQANGTPAMPWWVVIHPLSKTTVPELFTGLGKSVKDPIKTVTDDAKKYGPFGLPFAAKVLPRVAGSAALLAPEAPALKDAINVARGKDPFGNAQSPSAMMKAGYSSVLAKYFTLDKNNNLVPRRGTPQWMVNALQSTRSKGGLLGRIGLGFMAQHDINENQATKLINDILAGRVANTFKAAQRAKMQARVRPQSASPSDKLLTQTLPWLGQPLGTITLPASPGTGVNAVEATVKLEPTEELRNLLKPKKVRAHVPANQIGSPPTERGKAKTSRNRG